MTAVRSDNWVIRVEDPGGYLRDPFSKIQIRSGSDLKEKPLIFLSHYFMMKFDEKNKENNLIWVRFVDIDKSLIESIIKTRSVHIFRPDLNKTPVSGSATLWPDSPCIPTPCLQIPACRWPQPWWISPCGPLWTDKDCFDFHDLLCPHHGYLRTRMDGKRMLGAKTLDWTSR